MEGFLACLQFRTCAATQTAMPIPGPAAFRWPDLSRGLVLQLQGGLI